MTRKHCPHCGANIEFRGEITDGDCWRCEKEFVVVHRLRKVCIEKPFEKRNYENEILNFIKLRGKSFSNEIRRGVGISHGVTTETLRSLISKGILSVEQKGQYRWVKIRSE